MTLKDSHADNPQTNFYSNFPLANIKLQSQLERFEEM